MQWSEELKPNDTHSRYDHVYSETPLGRALIEWKSWKEHDDPCLTIGSEWIGCFDSLEEAKEGASEWLRHKASEILNFLKSK